MHVFLTGEIQVGKSTAIRRWLEARPELRLGGFRTVWRYRRGAEENSLHIVPAAGNAPLTADNRIGIRGGSPPGRRAQDFPEVFDRVGVPLLENSGGWDLILMDEIGIGENNAPRFRQAVLDCLNGDVPVLGVVKAKPGVLTDAVRAHPKTRIITVTVENRGAVLDELGRRWTAGGAGWR